MKQVSGTSRASQIALNAFFALYSLNCLLPIVLIAAVSFSSETDIIRDGYKFIPQNFSLEAYKFLFIDWMAIVRAYGVQLFVIVVGTLLSVLMMACYAYPISRPDFPHRRVFSFFAIFTMLFNGGLIPWYMVYVNILHLKDTLWALIMPFLGSAFWILVLRTFFQTSIPGPVIESARIDGAGELKTFLSIVLPLSTPVLASVALFQTLLYWNDFFLPMVFIVDQEKYTVQYLMYKALQNIQFIAQNPTIAAEITRSGGVITLPSETVRMAMGVMGIGPIVFAYPFFQRYFVKGLTLGAVKG
ncbi:carbohydrate ABC transporter permease [Paenibacillus alkalitolerans]|uniref:carbohydrate ABC transporter permease n=1 Tax=Paenibacillus alkalitolerans TaxID=2799335 RepID=UPI0018F5562A|nr:carbohydrate ABC transporter permease [Paenibacillus alkalitolerans]